MTLTISNSQLFTLYPKMQIKKNKQQFYLYKNSVTKNKTDVSSVSKNYIWF